MIFKRKLFKYCSLLSFLIITAAISGCSDSIVNSTSINTGKYKALTESQFNSNAVAYATPGAVVYVDLENLNAPPDSVREDTGAIGEDVIPYRYTETATHRIKLDAGAMFKARLVNEAGAVIYQLNAPGDTSRVSIPAGNYKLYLTSTISSDGAYGYSQPVFIQPDSAAITSGAGAPPQGGYDPDQLNQLLTTRKCTSCNLRGVTILFKDLQGADLTRAFLSNSTFDHVNFDNARFDNVQWDASNISSTSLKNASFDKTILNESTFLFADFSNAILTNASSVNLNFLSCAFRYTSFSSTGGFYGKWDNSDFSNATFYSTEINNVTCKNTKMNGTVFSNVQLIKVDFRGSVMDSLKLNNSTAILRCEFNGNRMRYAEFTDIHHQISFFENCDLTGAKIINSELPMAQFRGANLSNSLWDNVALDGADMCETVRTGAVFRNIRYGNPPSCWP
ncbi:MAG: pentapeptide repeat-containing protein [Bacteroidetes bacterium]|nr:pentapeptide repeat-containing protein [Bacteroidota bacterium]